MFQLLTDDNPCFRSVSISDLVLITLSVFDLADDIISDRSGEEVVLVCECVSRVDWKLVRTFVLSL